MASTKYNKPAPNLTPLLGALTAIASVGALLVSLPVGIVAWVGAIITAWMYPAPALTGTKQTAATEYEEQQQDKFRSWLRARGALLFGNGMGFETIWPGFPPRVSWFGGLGLAALVSALPLSAGVLNDAARAAGEFYQNAWDADLSFPWWMRIVNGALLAHTVLVLAARRRLVDEKPPITIPHPGRLWTEARLHVIALALLSPVAALAGMSIVRIAGEQSPTWTAVGAVGAILLTAYAVLNKPCGDISLKQWRLLKEARDEWGPIFERVFPAKDGSPRLISRTRLAGGGIVDEMDAPSKLQFAGVQKLQPQIEGELGGGSGSTFFIASPKVGSDGQEIPGTQHPLRLRIVRFEEDQFPDLLDPNIDEASLKVALECSMAAGMDAIGFNRLHLVSVDQVAVLPEKVAAPDERGPVRRALDTLAGRKGPEPVYPEHFPSDAPDHQGEREEDEEEGQGRAPGRVKKAVPEPPAPSEGRQALAVWRTVWGGPPGETPSIGGIQPNYEDVQQAMREAAQNPQGGVEIVVDRRAGNILVGDPLAEDMEFTPDSGLTHQSVQNVIDEITWERRWEKTLQQGANPPTARFELTREAQVPRRFDPPVVIHEQLFATREGLDAGETYVDPSPKSYEKAMAAAIPGDVPFCSFVAWPKKGEGRGTRHKHFFLVRWSEEAVPRFPQDLPPQDGGRRGQGIDTDGSVWVLAHLINQAFTSSRVKFPKPEIAAAECLTMPESSKHVWKATLMLYGGTTLGDVRAKFEAIRSALGAPWMRVQEAESGKVTLFMGDPNAPGVKIRRGKDKDILNVDFEQAWIDSSVESKSGLVPELLDLKKLPSNEQIDVLDFKLPPGLDFMRVRTSKDRLAGNLDAEYIEVRPGVHGAASARIYMSKEDPLPKSVGVPWDDLPVGDIAFATNALGETVTWELTGDGGPHLLLLGASGSGKSVSMRTILFMAMVAGFDVVVIDPTKGGHDFAFCQDYSIAPFGKEVFQAASILKAVYGEVEKRKALNDEHRAVNIGELPDDVRPRRILVLIDEFTSLLGRAPVPPKSDDPAVDSARIQVEAENNARVSIGSIVGKLAREARSVGIHLVLGTQKLTAKTLDSIPGAGDLRALALDTRIPVPISDKFPKGWAVNADLEVGDKVYAKGGDIASVVKLTETFENRDTYRIRFDDGQEFVVDAGHLWNASDAVSRKAHHSGRAVKVNRVESGVLPRLREISEKTPYGTVATVEELSEMSGIALTKAKKIIRDLSIPSFVASADRSVTVPAHVKVGTTPRLFPTCEASGLYGVDMQSLGEFATSRSIAEFVLGSSNKSDGGVFGTKMLSHGISPLDVDDRRMFDVQEFAHRAADFLENESKGYSLPLYRTVTTEEMHENPGRWAVALSPILGEEAHLPVDPYVLGAWLGDGSTGTGIISSATVPACTSADGTTDQQRMIDHLTEAGFEGHALECSPVFVGTRGLKVKLREAGVLDRKHIPAEYLRASYDQRLALLQGLMDTDGSVSANGRCIITQAREHLSLEILELVRSLGWDAHYWYGYYGGSHRYQVGFKADRPVFRLPRKVEKQDLSEHTPYRMIESIEKIDSTPVRCIGIDHPSHEFLVGEFVPTHNTNLARAAQGNTSQGDRMSAFRNPMEAEVVKSPRIGRGLFEPLTSNAFVYQSWYDDERVFAQKLPEFGIQPPTPDRVIDPEDPRFKLAPPEEFRELIEEDDSPVIAIEAAAEVEEVDVDVDFADLDFVLDDGPSEDSDQDAPDQMPELDLSAFGAQERPAQDETPSSPEPEEIDFSGFDEPSSPSASQFSSDPFEALEMIADSAEDLPGTVVWDLGALEDETPVGGTYRDLIGDVSSRAGVEIVVEDPDAPGAGEGTLDLGAFDEMPSDDRGAEDETEQEVDDSPGTDTEDRSEIVEPEPVRAPQLTIDDDDDDDFSFDFAPPPRVTRLD